MSLLFICSEDCDASSGTLPRMKEAGLTTSLDTNDDPDDGWGGGLLEALRYVDIFLPNEREVQKAAGVADLEAAVKSFRRWCRWWW